MHATTKPFSPKQVQKARVETQNEPPTKREKKEKEKPTLCGKNGARLF